MISLTRREFEIASNALSQVWTEAHWASLARRAQRRPTMPELEGSAARPAARAPVARPARDPRATH